MRLPYQSDPTAASASTPARWNISTSTSSHVAQFVWFGFLGQLDVAIVEVAGIRADGSPVPASSIGDNKMAGSRRPDHPRGQFLAKPALEGMHDIYYGTQTAAARKAHPDRASGDRIGETIFRCDPQKVIAVVETHAPDRNTTFAAPDAKSKAHRRPYSRISKRRGSPRQAAAGLAADPVRCRQRRQCGDGGPEDGPFPGSPPTPRCCRTAC